MYQTQPWGAWNLNREDKLRWEQKYYPAFQLGKQPQMIHLRRPHTPGAQPELTRALGSGHPSSSRRTESPGSCKSNSLWLDLQARPSNWLVTTQQLQLLFTDALALRARPSVGEEPWWPAEHPRGVPLDGQQQQCSQALGRMHLTSPGAGWRLEAAK